MSITERLNARVFGSGARTLVFAHGYGCDQGVWRHVAPAFAAGHQVVLYDLAGYGGSAAGSYDPTRHASLDGHAEDLLAVCDALGLQAPVVVGHSVSAATAVRAARLRPGFAEALVLVAPNPSYLNEDAYTGGFDREDIDQLLDTLDSNYFSWARMMAPVVMGNAQQPALGDELASTFCRADPEVARHFARVTFLSDSRDDLQHVVSPTLVLQCRDDVLAPLPVGEFVASRLPRGQLQVLDATGHCPHLSAPRETIAAMAAFLEALPTRPTAP